MDDDGSRVLGNAFVRRAARWGIVSWATIGVLVLGYFVFRYVIYPIRIIFPPLVVALIVVYMLNPIISALERRGMRRIWGALLVYLVFTAVVGTALYLLVPLVADQVTEFVRSAPALIRRTSRGFQDFVERFGVEVGGGAAQVQSSSVLDFLGRILSFTRGVFGLAIIFILGPILAFYFLVDLPKVKQGFRALIPARRRGEVEEVLDRIGNAIGGFFQGQLLVALFVGVASAIGLWIVGLPFWALVGFVSGLFNLIPLIGPWIGGIVAVLIAFTTQAPPSGLLNLEPGLPLAVGSAIVLLIVQQIDNHVLSPNIVGRTVRLHPVTVMLGLLAGGTLLGLWGMLLAVPVLASAKIVLLHAWDTRMQWPPPSSGEHPVPRERPPEPAQRPERSEPSTRAPWWSRLGQTLFGRRERPRETVEARPGGRPGEEAAGDGGESDSGVAEPERASPGAG